MLPVRLHGVLEIADYTDRSLQVVVRARVSFQAGTNSRKSKTLPEYDSNATQRGCLEGDAEQIIFIHPRNKGV